MRNFKIKVYFKKDILIQPEIVLVKNDYNSTEFEFEFDIEDGKKVFELKKPDKKVIIKEIVDNKIVLVDYDKDNNMIPVINQSGEYNFEIVCYDENSKITATQKGNFFARDEVVDLDEDKLSENVKIPHLDSLINETIEASNNSKEQAGYAKEQGDYAKGQGNYAKDVASNVESKLNNGDFVGATFKPSVDKEGNLSWTNDKGLDNPSSSNIMGPQGPQGIQGEAFTIKKTYSSKEEMNNDFDNMQIGDYVMITSNVELEDNAKMYSRGQEEWIFITDFSGATGIQGPQGIQGIQGIQGPKGDKGDKPIKCVDYFTETDKNEMVSSITDDANSEFNINVNEKLAEYNQNHEEKMQEYNSNTEMKVNEFNEEIETLKDELNDCYNNQLVGQAEGTSIQVKNSADARLKSLEIDGALEQETTKGINLVDFSNPNIIQPNTNFSFENDVLDISNESGTYTNISYNILDLINKNKGKKLAFYYESFINDIGNHDDPVQLRINYNDGTSNSFPSLIKYNGERYTYNIPENTDNIVVMELRLFSNNTKIDSPGHLKITKPMLYFGTTTDDVEYEPYTGGQASPNPEYPSEVEILEAKNLFDFSKWLNNSFSTFHGTTEKFENGLKITSTDNDCYTATYCNQVVYSDKFEKFGLEVEPNQDYTLSFKRNNSNSGRVYIFFHDENQNFISQINTLNSSLTFKTPENAKYLTLRFGVSNANQTIIYSDIQLEKGTIIHPYAPFSCIQTKVVNKNLIKNNLKTTTINGITATVNDDGSINFKGEVERNTTFYLFKKENNFLKPGITYTLSQKCTLPIATYLRISNDSNNSIFYGIGSSDSPTSNSLTFINNKDLSDEIDCFIWFGSNSVGETVDFTVYPQLEEGLETEYISYQEETVNIDLQDNFVAKINNEIKDTIHIENGHAILTKRIGKHIFDGTEDTWLYNNEYKNETMGFLCIIDGMKNTTYNNKEIDCNKFTFGITWNKDDEVINNSSNKVIFRIKISRLDSADISGFKKWLSENHPILYYPLAESYDVDLGPVKLPKTFKGISNIFLNANLETNMHVDYVKDTQLVIDDLQSQIDNITALLSTTNTSALLLDNLQSDLEGEVI